MDILTHCTMHNVDSNTRRTKQHNTHSKKDLSSDSEEEIFRTRTPVPLNTTTTAGVDEEDNPVYQSDSDHDTQTAGTVTTVAIQPVVLVLAHTPILWRNSQ